MLIVGAVAIGLGWAGIGIFKSASPPADENPSSAPAETSAASATRSEEAAPVIGAPPAAAQPEVVQQPDPPTTAVNEVLPDVPQSALDTIHGTVRVAVRVTIDKQGTVIDTTTVDRGPSRYFERLSVEAAKKWTFTPANLQDERALLVRFNYTRTAATAQAGPAQ
jgi:TonB family protein